MLLDRLVLRIVLVLAGIVGWALLPSLSVAQEDHEVKQRVTLNHNQAMQLTLKGDILPLEKVISMAHIPPSDKMLEASLRRCHQRYVYLLEILDSQDHIWDLLIDATTGERIKP